MEDVPWSELKEGSQVKSQTWANSQIRVHTLDNLVVASVEDVNPIISLKESVEREFSPGTVSLTPETIVEKEGTFGVASLKKSPDIGLFTKIINNLPQPSTSEDKNIEVPPRPTALQFLSDSSAFQTSPEIADFQFSQENMLQC